MVDFGKLNRDFLNGLHLIDDGFISEMLKTVVEHTGGVGETTNIANTVYLHTLGTQDDADKMETAFFGGRDQTVAGIVGRSGLDAVCAGVAITDHTPVGEQMVGGIQLALCADVGCGNGIGCAICNGHEFLVLHSGPGNQIHVPGRGIVLRIVEAVSIYEMGVFAAEHFCLLVHLVNKCRSGTSNCLGQNVAGLIGRNDHHTVQQVSHRHGFTGLDIGGAAIGGESGQCGFTCGYILIQRQLSLFDSIKGQQSGHDFGQTGRIQFIVLVMSVYHSTGIVVHQQGSLGQNFGIVRQNRGVIARCKGGRNQKQAQEKSQKKR